jgi:hypothetical protein
LLRTKFRTASIDGQLKSGLEDGRTGGPGPTVRDDFDLKPGVFDVGVPFAELDSLTFRAGRQELASGSSRLISIRENSVTSILGLPD